MQSHRTETVADRRAAAARARSRSVRAGFLVGVLLGAVFIAVVLAPWAASVAMRRGKSWHYPPPPATQPAQPDASTRQTP